MVSIHRNRGARSVLFTIVMLMLSLGGLVACGQTTAGSSSSPTTAPSTAATSQPTAMTITAMEYSFALPQTVPAGLIDITLVNNGTQPHVAQLVLLKSGVTLDQFQRALLQKGLLVMRTLGIILGGPNVAAPGQRSEVILNLPGGQYAVVSPALGKDGKRDYQKGIIASFTVTGSAPTGQAATPTASAQITMQSFSYRGIPASVAAGAVTWQVTNAGTEPYEFDVLKLAPGKTAQDVIAFLTHPSGPPPFVDIGGMASISPGISGWVKFNLTAGTYVALSHVFDKATGKPEFLLGMITTFTVQ